MQVEQVESFEKPESGPLDSAELILGGCIWYDSLDEANKEIASGALTAPEI